MTESNQTSAVPLSASKKNKTKIFYEHGKDALSLALAVAHMVEEKTSRKAERHHQPQHQVARSQTERRNRDRARHKRERLEETKAMISKRRAAVKKEKARSRKESNGRLRRRDDTSITASEDIASAAPRKRVSFA